VVNDPEPTWHRPMRHNTMSGGGDASASSEVAGQTSNKARCAASNIGGWWQPGALPDLLPPHAMGARE
jgi:hypothetical protein